MMGKRPLLKNMGPILDQKAREIPAAFIVRNATRRLKENTYGGLDGAGIFKKIHYESNRGNQKEKLSGLSDI